VTLAVPADDRDRVIGELWEAGTTGIIESEDWMRAFFDDRRPEPLLRDRLREFTIEFEQVEERDWVAESRRQWQPFPVGDRFYLVPEWRDDPAPCGRIRLRMHPGMACGTGTHPATQLCLIAMERHVCEGAAVLDLGAGSGILTEAARLLGGDPVFGCDIDHEATEISRRNLAASVFHIPLFTGSLRSIRDASLDIVVANLNAATLAAVAYDAVRVVRPPGKLIISGFREYEADGVARLFECEVVDHLELNDWTCLVLSRHSAMAQR
jgi:ribosomal protein L11 methyltransferase